MVIILNYCRFRIFGQRKAYKLRKSPLQLTRAQNYFWSSTTTTATSVHSKPSSNKLRLLENLYWSRRLWRDSGKTSFRIIQDSGGGSLVYLRPTVLTEKEKCRLCFSGNVTVIHIPISYRPKLRKCTNFELVIRARRQHVFSDWFCKEFLSFFYCSSSSQ